MTTLPDDVRDLLTAIIDALNMPLAAAGDDRAERQYVRLLEKRTWYVLGTLRAALDQSTAPDIAVRVIRRSIADTPVTYPVYVPAGKDTDGADQADAGESTRAVDAPDPLLYGPGGYRCGCGKDAHSNLVPCAPERTAVPEIVALRSRDGRQLRCPAHAPAPSLIGLDWAVLTGLEVDGDDSRCTECGTDVLADPAPAACARCRRPFDPADTRFDGHARHADTPWCRRCIDNCHEGDADHRCIICTPDAYTTGGAR